MVRMTPFGTQDTIRLSDVVSALSLALDLTEGQPMGHAIRSCILGMRIAQQLQLPPDTCSDLYYALLLKDSGCSTNAARLHQIMGADEIQAKREIKLQDWTGFSPSILPYLARNVLPGGSLLGRLTRMIDLGIHRKRNNAELIGSRCERGAEIARKIGLSETAAQGIRSLDEHWNGQGYPEGRKAEQIPLLGRIINISQTLEVFASKYGSQAAISVVCKRSGTWFDPAMVPVVRALGNDDALWRQLKAEDARQSVLRMEPGAAIPASPERIDSLCHAFAEVIDAKSPYTFRHSKGVAEAATQIAQEMGLAPGTVTMVRRAALLHDIGKLSVSNAILEKPDKLTDSEWVIMKMHPVYTRKILEMIAGFEHLAYTAGAHHEKLDGSGYPEGLKAEQMTLPARIIAVADVFQALSETRPYREGLAPEVVFEIMQKATPHHLDPDCFAVLKHACAGRAAGVKVIAASAGH
jgi:putative nucleotidyltransferase with HDIG domain